MPFWLSLLPYAKLELPFLIFPSTRYVAFHFTSSNHFSPNKGIYQLERPYLSIALRKLKIQLLGVHYFAPDPLNWSNSVKPEREFLRFAMVIYIVFFILIMVVDRSYDIYM